MNDNRKLANIILFVEAKGTFANKDLAGQVGVQRQD